MRIQELLEGKKFNDLDFVKHTSEGREIDFDLAEDLIHFMNHDDDVYRRHTYPAIAKCLDRISGKKSTKTSIFKDAVEESYKIYAKRFPIRELPDNLDGKMCEEVCDKIHEELLKHIEDGKYKD
jgi:hypothetical protein